MRYEDQKKTYQLSLGPESDSYHDYQYLQMSFKMTATTDIYVMTGSVAQRLPISCYSSRTLAIYWLQV